VEHLSDLWRPLATLVLASLIVMGSPGPATMSVTAVGAAFGLRRSAGYLAGIVLGTSTVLCAVAAGVVSMLMSVPRLAPVLIGASAVYMVWLAWKIATAPPLSAGDEEPRIPSFAGGFLLAIANPKAYAAIAAVFAGTTLGLESRPAETLLKTAVLVFMIVVIHLVWAMVGASFSRLLHHPVAARIINVAFAAILVVTTIIALLS
jgi:threonine/homoserine/homoserine lactone efflux protein